MLANVHVSEDFNIIAPHHQRVFFERVKEERGREKTFDSGFTRRYIVQCPGGIIVERSPSEVDSSVVMNQRETIPSKPPSLIDSIPSQFPTQDPVFAHGGERERDKLES
jgi:hypothetical protein